MKVDPLINRLIHLKEGVSSSYANYVETKKITKKVFDKFVKKDPSRNKKYIDWMCKQAVLDPDKTEHMSDVVIAFDSFASKNLIKKKDIYQHDLESAEKEIDQASKKEEIKSVAKGKEKDIEVIVDTPDILIVSPRTKEASCKYGEHTKWCTSAQSSYNYFASYANRGVKLYYIIDKSTNTKYAVAVHLSGKKECYDEKDKSIPFPVVKKVLQKASLNL